MSTACCDEQGWKVDASGTVLDPAEHCPRHTGKQAATKPGQPAPADPPDLRDGNKNKFAWFYEMLADPNVSLAAKVVGSGCVMKMAGRKGHFKATRKAIANLCGISQSTVRRGLADLIDKQFLDADIHEGAASTYHLILPDQRAQMRLEAEQRYERDTARAESEIRSWLWAEKLHFENQFRAAIAEAAMARGADQAGARTLSDLLLGKMRERGLDIDIEHGLASVAAWDPEVFVAASAGAGTTATQPADSEYQRADPGPSESRPRPAGEPTPVRLRADPGTPESRPRPTPDDPTSGNGQTHKSFKDSERPVKVFQELESTPALRNALNARPPHGAAGPVERDAATCRLCNDEGIFRDRFDEAVVLVDEDGYTDPVDCQHSMAANLAHIQRREILENLSLCQTGWPEIDSHYPNFINDFEDF